FLARKARDGDGNPFAGPRGQLAPHELGIVGVGQHHASVAVQVEVRRTTRRADGREIDDLPAHSIRAEDVQLAVARQVEASIGGYRATARAYRPVDARSCIYDERDARR